MKLIRLKTEAVRAPARAWPRAALVIAGHGSLHNPDSGTPTHRHAAEIRRRWLFAEVEPAFWKEQPSFREALQNLESREVFIVPNFISDGYFTQEILPREFGLRGALTTRGGVRHHFCRPVGSHPLMTHVILSHALRALDGVRVEPQETALLILGHGTEQNASSSRAILDQAAAIRRMNRYGEVHAAFLDQAPGVAGWQDLTSLPNVVMVPFFISNGLHCYEDIPRKTGIARAGGGAAGAELFARSPYVVHGRRVWYTPAVGTEPHIADVIIDLVKETDERHRSLL